MAVQGSSESSENSDGGKKPPEHQDSQAMQDRGHDNKQEMKSPGSEFATSAAVLEVLQEARRRRQPKEESPPRVWNLLVKLWRLTLGRWGEDWLFLAILGLLMAFVSYAMDEIVAIAFKVRLWLYHTADINLGLQYLAWISIPVVLMVGAALLVGMTAPQAAGSGLPELKAILRGGSLEGYFGIRTLIAKFVGITCTLGTGMPLGREGSLIHISAILAAMLGRVIGSFDSMTKMLTGNAGSVKNADLLAAACAVGVSTTFASPIGGVLFSIEVTSVYFAVRNYWRGFFAAVCGAVVFRLLAVWFEREDTVRAIYLTNFPSDFPFDPQELLGYAVVGVVSGFGAALYVWMHRKCVTFVRTNPIVQKYIYVFVAFTVLCTVSMTFPAGIGQFMAGDLYTVDQVKCLFKNFSFAKTNLTAEEADVLSHWNVDQYGVFTSLGVYIVFTWLFSIWCSSMPVPLGNFGPVFKMGAAVGRFVGELMLIYFPRGVTYGAIHDTVFPGSYATVAAAAFSGAVTHTVSTSVIVFEMTGQVTHTFPIMIAVLIANGICTILQPSIYDSLILIKELPYLPHLYPTICSYKTYVRDFMVKTVRYVWNGMSYGEILELLKEFDNLEAFPLVNSPDDMILVGSVRREELERLLQHHLGDERRRLVAAQLSAEAQDPRAAKDALSGAERTRWSGDDLPGLNLTEVNITGTGSVGRNRKLPRVFVSMDNMGFQDDECNGRLAVVPVSREIAESRVCTVPSGMDSPRPLRRTWGGAIPMPAPGESIPTLHAGALAACDTLGVGGTQYNTVPSRRSRGSDGQGQVPICEALRRSSSGASLSGIFGGRVGEPSETEISTDPSPILHSLHESLDAVDMTAPLVMDMSPEERRRWEEAELRRPAALGACEVDPAPFNLVASTPLARAHSLFCLLGLKRAYVTLVGRLVGVFSISELWQATDASNAGMMPQRKTGEQIISRVPSEVQVSQLLMTPVNRIV